MNDGTLLSVRELVIEYDSGGYPVRPIDGFDLDGREGELIVLLGPSGCGKTSLLSALGGILQPKSGAIRVRDLAVESLTGAALADYRQRYVGFVFQAFNLVASLTVRENVAMPLILAGVRRSVAFDRAEELLDRVGLADKARSKPGKLSGGQQQRTAVARGLAADPPMLLADEPTANLDYIQAEGIISLLRELRADGRLIVVSTHDDRLVPIADRVVHLVPGFREDEQPPRTLDVVAGELVFEQGDRGELVYVIESGRIDILRTHTDGTVEELAHLGPGEYFGELGPMLGFPRSATARAAVATRLRAFNVHDFREHINGTKPAAATAGAPT